MSIHQPIKLPVSVFSSADANAPQLSPSGNAGEIKTLLKACLITGYGTTPAVDGWAMPFEDGDKAVFHSTDPRATGFCLRLDNNGGKTGQVTCYESMTDIDTGVTQWFDCDAGFASRYGSMIGWRVFATSTSFILFVETDSGGVAASFFGAGVSIDNNESGNCVAIFSENYYYGAHVGNLSRQNLAFIARKRDGTAGGESMALLIISACGEATTHIAHPVFWKTDNRERMLFPWRRSVTEEAITAHNETIQGRDYYVTNLAGQYKFVYFIPTDYWLL